MLPNYCIFSIKEQSLGYARYFYYAAKIVYNIMIHIFTSLYPTSTRGAGGFISERINILQKEKIPYKLYVIVPKYSQIVKLLYKFIRGKQLDTTPIGWCIDAEQIIVHMSTLGVILWMIHPFYYTKKMYASLLSKDIRLDSSTIFHAQYYFPLGFCVSKLGQLYGVKSIITCHDNSSIKLIEKLNSNNKRKVSSILKQTDRIIFVSQGILNSALSRDQVSDNTVVIHNGMNHDYFNPIPFETAVDRTRYRPSKKYVVGFVGRIVYEKRADKFPEIFSHIKSIIDDVEFIIVGPQENKSYISMLEKLPFDVKLIGAVTKDELNSWYNLFDVLILPSRHEAWGLVVREAYACGIPVVGSDVEGIPESMGGMGVLVPDGDNFEVRFASAVCDVLLGNVVVKREELIEFVKDTTWDAQTKKEIELYKSLSDTQ